jgi:CheY-like chemotaxis protein
VLPDLRGTSVLVIEDDLVVRRVYRLWLEELGASVREAANGFEGLELVWMARPDIVPCDIAMPSFDGYSFIKGLREDFKLRTPVIAVSGKMTVHAVAQASDAGFVDYLAKPVSFEELADCVARMLAR